MHVSGSTVLRLWCMWCTVTVLNCCCRPAALLTLLTLWEHSAECIHDRVVKLRADWSDHSRTWVLKCTWLLLLHGTYSSALYPDQGVVHVAVSFILAHTKCPNYTFHYSLPPNRSWMNQSACFMFSSAWPVELGKVCTSAPLRASDLQLPMGYSQNNHSSLMCNTHWPCCVALHHMTHVIWHL